MSNYPSRLTPSEIKYLALEGGGGKGNAYVGALESLGHSSLNVIRNSGYRLTNIEGVSGASAGAITSLFLACGFSPLELKTITELEDFNRFFDGPNPGRVFRIGGFQTQRRHDPEAAELGLLVQEVIALLRDADPVRIARYIARHARVRELIRHLEEVNDLLSSLLSSSDAFEAARRIQEMTGHLARLGTTDAMGAIMAVSEILMAIPSTVWGHLVQISVISIRLLRLRIHRQQITALFAQIALFMTVIRALVDDATLQVLLARDPQATATAFTEDFGIMTGEEIYNFFRRWLAVARLRVNEPASYERYLAAAGGDVVACFAALKAVVEAGTDTTLTRYRDDNMTFEAFEREFRIKFAVTGSNLENLRSHVFSGATTPRFYVVDAVRLSMSLPYCIFKPLIVREDDPGLPGVIARGESVRERDPVSNTVERHPLVGVWVDGGIFNNIPSHVFDREAGRKETLSLRLDSSAQEQPASVTQITDYFQRFPGGVMFGTGEALSSRSYDNKYRSIALDTGNLNLLSFSPSAAEAAAVRRTAIEYVFRYFDTPLPQDL